MTWPEFVALVEAEIKAKSVDPTDVHIDYIDFGDHGRPPDVYVTDKSGLPLWTLVVQD